MKCISEIVLLVACFDGCRELRSSEVTDYRGVRVQSGRGELYFGIFIGLGLIVVDAVTPGEVYNVNGICKAATGEMKPLCRTFQFTTPCTRPNVTTLLLQSRARRELRVWLVVGIHPS